MRERDERDFEQFVAASTPALLRTAFLLTGDRDGAQDLLQESFVRLYGHWGRIADPQARLAYVRKIMTTTAANGRRRRWHREVATGRADGDTRPGEDPYAESDLRTSLAAALRDLSPAHRAVLVLRFYEDLSEARTARALGCSAGTVKSRTARALDALRQQGVDVFEDAGTRSTS